VTESRVVNIKKEPCDVYIGRPSKWGNQYVVGIDGNREEVIAMNRRDFLNNSQLQADAEVELRGMRLGCFCKPKSCHGDVYVEFLETPRLNFQ